MSDGNFTCILKCIKTSTLSHRCSYCKWDSRHDVAKDCVFEFLSNSLEKWIKNETERWWIFHAPTPACAPILGRWRKMRRKRFAVEPAEVRNLIPFSGDLKTVELKWRVLNCGNVLWRNAAVLRKDSPEVGLKFEYVKQWNLKAFRVSFLFATPYRARFGAKHLLPRSVVAHRRRRRFSFHPCAINHKSWIMQTTAKKNAMLNILSLAASPCM